MIGSLLSFLMMTSGAVLAYGVGWFFPDALKHLSSEAPGNVYFLARLATSFASPFVLYYGAGAWLWAFFLISGGICLYKGVSPRVFLGRFLSAHAAAFFFALTIASFTGQTHYRIAGIAGGVLIQSLSAILPLAFWAPFTFALFIFSLWGVSSLPATIFFRIQKLFERTRTRSRQTTMRDIEEEGFEDPMSEYQEKSEYNQEEQSIFDMKSSRRYVTHSSIPSFLRPVEPDLKPKEYEFAKERNAFYEKLKENQYEINDVLPSKQLASKLVAEEIWDETDGETFFTAPELKNNEDLEAHRPAPLMRLSFDVPFIESVNGIDPTHARRRSPETAQTLETDDTRFIPSENTEVPVHIKSFQLDVNDTNEGIVAIDQTRRESIQNEESEEFVEKGSREHIDPHHIILPEDYDQESYTTFQKPEPIEYQPFDFVEQGTKIEGADDFKLNSAEEELLTTLAQQNAKKDVESEQLREKLRRRHEELALQYAKENTTPVAPYVPENIEDYIVEEIEAVQNSVSESYVEPLPLTKDDFLLPSLGIDEEPEIEQKFISKEQSLFNHELEPSSDRELREILSTNEDKAVDEFVFDAGIVPNIVPRSVQESFVGPEDEIFTPPPPEESKPKRIYSQEEVNDLIILNDKVNIDDLLEKAIDKTVRYARDEVPFSAMRTTPIENIEEVPFGSSTYIQYEKNVEQEQLGQVFDNVFKKESYQDEQGEKLGKSKISADQTELEHLVSLADEEKENDPYLDTIFYQKEMEVEGDSSESKISAELEHLVSLENKEKKNDPYLDEVVTQEDPTLSINWSNAFYKQKDEEPNEDDLNLDDFYQNAHDSLQDESTSVPIEENKESNTDTAPFSPEPFLELNNSKEDFFNEEEFYKKEQDIQDSFDDDRLEAPEAALMPRVIREDIQVDNPSSLVHIPLPDPIFPSTDGLTPNTEKIDTEEESIEIDEMVKTIEKTFESFNISMKVVDYSRGPSITRFELEPPSGLKLRTIRNLQDDIALQLGTSNIRIISPVEGRSFIGIEVPNTLRRSFLLKEFIEGENFQESSAALPLILGMDIGANSVCSDLSILPHLLVAGTTGSGKSVYINALIAGLLFKLSPRDLKFIMIDPKMVELELYNGIPHLLAPIITKPEEAMAALDWAVQEMDRRYKLLSDNGVRNIKEYTSLATDSFLGEEAWEHLPYIVIIVDEFANLMLRAPKDTEKSISRLAAMARAVGMHLVIATQRPSVDVVTGIIKANFPCRIAFRVSSKTDSRTILDRNGAEALLGKGDMLYISPEYNEAERMQSPFVPGRDVEDIVNAVKKNGPPNYVIDFEELLASQNNRDESDGSMTDALSDPMFAEVLRYAVDSGEISASGIQRRFRVGYNRASRLIETLKDQRIISPPTSAGKGWQVLITKDQIIDYID